MFLVRISLLLLASCLFARAAADGRGVDESQAYKNINAYLNEMIEDPNWMQHIERYLVEALEATRIAEAVPNTTTGLDEPGLAKLTEREATVKGLQPVLHNLLQASTSCDREHIDLLNHVASNLV